MTDSWIGGYRFFTQEEMRCKGIDCDCKGTLLPKHSFMLELDMLRGLCGFPFIVNRCASCPSHDMFIRKKDTPGTHSEGIAVDLRIAGEKVISLLNIAHILGFTGFGINQVGSPSKRFVHLDIKPAPIRIWTY